jgi:hypothetical protein
MQTEIFFLNEKPTPEEIVKFIKHECARTQKRISQSDVRNHLGVGRKQLQAEMKKAYDLLKTEGWVPTRGPGGGMGPPEWGVVNSIKPTKPTKALAKVTPQILTEAETELNSVEQTSLCKDMYFNHVKGLFDDMRSSLEDERLEDFHPEIEEFLSHTKQHLIGVINKL